MSNLKDLKDFLNQFSRAFTTKKVSYQEERITVLKETIFKDEFQGIVRAAHDGMLPDNWKYKMISNIVSGLEVISRHCNAGNVPELFEAFNDQSHELIDGLVSVNNSDLTNWLSSASSRAYYIDQACEELGRPENTISQLQYGQFQEYSEILGIILKELEQKFSE